MADNAQTAAAEDEEFPLPAPFVQLLKEIEQDRQKLLKNRAAMSNPEALLTYMANTVNGRIAEAVRLLGRGAAEAHLLGRAVGADQARMRVYVLGKLRELGASVDPEAFEGALPEDAVRAVNDSLAALGLLLEKRLPGDAEVQACFNAHVDALLTLLSAELQETDEAEEPGAEAPEGS